MKKISIVALTLSNLIFSQASTIICGDENPNNSTIDSRTHEVNALMIYVSFPEQNQPYPIPDYVTINKFSPAQAQYHITAFDNSQNESDPKMNRWVHYNPSKTMQPFSSITDYFPMKVGKQWIYHSDAYGLFEINITGSSTFDSLTYFSFDQFYRYTNDVTNLRWDDSNRVHNRVSALVSGGTVDRIFYDFSAEVGESWDVFYRYEDDPLMVNMTLMSKNDTVYSAIDTFYNCYRFRQDRYPEGYLDEWFTSNIGLVQREETYFDNDTTIITESLIDTNTIVGIDDEILIPQHFKLFQPYPNPFNPVTTLRFDLPEPSLVTLTIYDFLGREITVLVKRKFNSGFKQVNWDGRDTNQKPVASGMYIASLSAESLVTKRSYRQSRKLVLLK